MMTAITVQHHFQSQRVYTHTDAVLSFRSNIYIEKREKRDIKFFEWLSIDV